MKKFTLLSLILVLSLGMFAQERAMKPAKGGVDQKEAVSVSITRYTKADEFNNAVKAFGDVIYEDDFSTGGPGAGALPTGWTSADMDAQGNNYTWQWTDIGAQGPTTGGYEYILASTSAANGWLILDSDNYGQGSYDSYLYSPIFDLSAYDAVAITFEELYQRWGNESANPYGGNPTFIGVSADGGVTFTEYEIHADFDSKESTDNPGYMMVNISATAGLQMNVQIYFRIQGLWDYWWQIDDFKVIEGAHNNLRVDEITAEGVVDGYAWGYFSHIPYSQNMDMVFFTSVTNVGVDAQTNVQASVDVSDGTTIVFSQTADTSSLAPDSTITLYPDFFTATVAGEYAVSGSVSQTEVEEVPEDNVSDVVDWKVTENNIIARDYMFSQALSPSMWTDGGDGDFLGVDFTFPNATSVKSLSVFIDFRSTPGTTIIGQVYLQGQEATLQIESEEYVISEQDLGQWVELFLITQSADDDSIMENGLYTAGVEFYWGGDDEINCWIGADSEGPHVYDQNTAYREGSTWYWVPYIPMVRMNLAGAVLPPVFSAPLNAVCAHPVDDVTYTLDMNVTDPQGLPVTLSAVTLPDFVTSFVDNGGGNATLTFEMTPDDISEFGYTCTFQADNGSAMNEQFFWMYVSEDANCGTISIEEELVDMLKVYPNPTTGILSVENALGADIAVYNIVGELVTSVSDASVLTTIDLSDLAEGTYVVKVVSEDEVVSTQINLIK